MFKRTGGRILRGGAHIPIYPSAEKSDPPENEFPLLAQFFALFYFFKWKLKKINNFHACGNIVQNIREKEKRTSEI